MSVTDCDALFAMIDERPDDSNARLVLADYLEELAGTEACPHCRHDAKYGTMLDPRQYVSYDSRTNRMEYNPPDDNVCVTCSGTGCVPDQFARLAIGYRALGKYGKYAFAEREGHWFWANYVMREPEFCMEDDYPYNWPHHLPSPWLDRICLMSGASGSIDLDGELNFRTWPSVDGRMTRREVETAAALAWAHLTDAERAACDRELLQRTA